MTTWKKPDRPFAELLNHEGTVAVDGAMGTQLYERGVLYSTCFEELNLSRPELIRRVHEDYIRAGAQVIETNTFGANVMRLEKHGLSHRVRDVNIAAVALAREAADGHAYVTGAIGPSGYFLGEASAADLDKVRASLLEQARVLVEAGRRRDRRRNIPTNERAARSGRSRGGCVRRENTGHWLCLGR